MLLNDLIAHIETTAPPRLAAPWDKNGVQIAADIGTVRTLCVALDPSLETVLQAVDLGAEVLLCHHPLTLSPRLPDRVDDLHRVLALCLGNGLLLYSAHTSLDANPDGPVNWLGRMLGLHDMRVLDITTRETPYLIREPDARRTPEEAAELVLWPNELEALLCSSPTMVTQAIPLHAPCREYGFGCLGTVPSPLPCQELLAALEPFFSSPPRFIGVQPETVDTVAYCPGSGADLAGVAFRCGAQIFLTGDVKFHQAQAMQDQGFCIDVGHFCLEEHMMREWSRRLENELPAIQVIFLPGRDPFA